MNEINDLLMGKNKDVVTVTPETALVDAARLLADHEIGVLVVLDGGGAVAGMLSERDVASALGRFAAGAAEKTVGETMTSPVISCTPLDGFVDVLVLMEDHHVRHLPVIDDGRLVGILSIRDLQTAWLDALDRECEQLRDHEAA